MGQHLFPREHGAWVQLLLPIVSALLVGRPSVAAWLMAVAALLVFTAHESLVVVLGQRGARKRDAYGRRAAAMLVGLSIAAAGCGLAALTMVDSTVMLSLLAPLLAALLAVPMLMRRRERTTQAEVTIAVALAALALPIGLAAAVQVREAVIIWLVWTATFVSMTLAARGVLAMAKKGAPSRRLLIHALGASTVALGAAIVLVVAGLVGAAVAWSMVPTFALCVALAVRTPPAKRLMRVGLALLAGGLITTAALVVGPL
ncbi:MAG: hypothetical protein ACI9MR_003132 [Myxococcota bacterium]|jgi:hypothetical protein